MAIFKNTNNNKKNKCYRGFRLKATPYTLMLGRQTGPGILEISMAIPKKLYRYIFKNYIYIYNLYLHIALPCCTTIRSWLYILYLWRILTQSTAEMMHNHAYCFNGHNRQFMESANMYITRWRDTWNMVRIHNGISFTNKEKWNDFIFWKQKQLQIVILSEVSQIQ